MQIHTTNVDGSSVSVAISSARAPPDPVSERLSPPPTTNKRGEDHKLNMTIPITQELTRPIRNCAPIEIDCLNPKRAANQAIKQSA